MSGLFDALNTSVTGLTSQATAMSNISNNIANAQTTAFKATNTSFADLVNQSSIAATRTANGGGAIALSSQNVGLQGTLTASSTGTNLGVSGDGFFAVQTGTVNSSGSVGFGGNTEYTRRGDFSLNAQGYLVNGTGSYLEGYSVNPANQQVNSSTLVPIQISQSPAPPVPTSSVTVDANLPANSAVGATLTPTTVQVYDAQGNTHSVTVNWTQTASGAWTADVSAPDASFDNSLALTFGTGAGAASGTIQTVANAGAGTTFTVPSGAGAAAGQPAQASFTTNFGSGPQTITLNFGSFNQASGLTQFSAADQQVDVTSVTQNGLPTGTFENISFDQSGNVNINYSNGESKTVYQIPLTRFENPNALEENSSGNFTQTGESGTPTIGVAGANGTGTIQSSELETSNVDLTSEFTKMIQTQQIYSANSRAITTANDMLASLLAIIHS